MVRSAPGRTREQVFRFVRQRLLEGSPPTLREVQAAMGFGAVESARRHLEALVAEGRLVKHGGRARGYRLTEKTHSTAAARVPLVGRVEAGDLQTAVESPEGHVLVETKRDAAELFALRVRGDSMVGAGILSGDVVVVRRQQRAQDGDVVVALVDDQATVKVLRRRAGAVELQPANPAYAPIVPDPRELRILGKVIEVRRRL
jgi:repressor LexA